MGKLKRFILLLILILVLGLGAKNVLAQTSPSVLYVPLIGLTSVPQPLALPNGAGNVTYNYAVKNFISEVALTNVQVVDDKCTTIRFVTGDDNKNSKLDYNETWRYTCSAKLSETTQNTAIATGIANNIIATHKAYSTVVVGSSSTPPLVSIINITKVAYPLSLPSNGGKITFTYKVNNPGLVPLSNVSVTDDKCSAISGRLGDTNGNNLLDVSEVWIYTCTTTLKETTTNTVNVVAFANGLKAVGDATITVKVDTPNFPNAGTKPVSKANFNLKTVAWEVMSSTLMLLILIYILRKSKIGKSQGSLKILGKSVLSLVFFAGVIGSGYYLLLPTLSPPQTAKLVADGLFGWKFPIAKFPLTGPGDKQIAYSDIRDPGGIPQGLPVRLKIPTIGVDSAIEDALITNDGRMDVPVGSVNVAWFSLGPHPGQVGSAVIGGHFGISDGVPWVFYNLDKLRGGDKIYIVDDKGDTLAFVVKAIRSFDRNADSTTVFTSSDGIAHLNLITCEGVWNQVNGTYPLRLVIFTDAIPSEGAVAVKKPVTTAKPVIVAKVTITPTNAPTASPTSIPKELLTAPISNEKSSISAKILIASAKSFYQTPIDGIITSFLLVSILFVSVKIIRK